MGYKGGGFVLPHHQHPGGCRPCRTPPTPTPTRQTSKPGALPGAITPIEVETSAWSQGDAGIWSSGTLWETPVAAPCRAAPLRQLWKEEASRLQANPLISRARRNMPGCCPNTPSPLLLLQHRAGQDEVNGDPTAQSTRGIIPASKIPFPLPARGCKMTQSLPRSTLQLLGIPEARGFLSHPISPLWISVGKPAIPCQRAN